MGFELSPRTWNQLRNRAISGFLGLPESGSAPSLAICLCLSFPFLTLTLSQFPSPGLCLVCFLSLFSGSSFYAYKVFPVIPLITVAEFPMLNLNRSPTPVCLRWVLP